MKIRWLLAFLLTGCVTAAVAESRERVVWANVTKVEPLVEMEAIAPTHPACFEPKPEAGAGLAALLAWDLAASCAIERKETNKSYRVTYQWDGRAYVHEMERHPGNRIALLLEVDLAPHR